MWESVTSTTRVFHFGVFELDARSGELRRHGLKIRLPRQSFEILRILLDRPGDVVTREELRQHLWTADTFVDFNVGLNSAVRKLREALDDSAENPRFVETLPRRGYRFIASVTPTISDPIPEPAPEPGADEPPERTAGETDARRRFPAWIAGGLAIVVAIAATLALAYASRGSAPPGAGVAAGQVRSLAVLPFKNLTGDPTQDYFVDGMTDTLTTDLAQVAGLDVISQTSAMQYKDAKKPAPAIGQELKVDGLLEGSVGRSGQQLRITVQLIHARTDRHVWARSYAGQVSEVLTLQRQIAREIATAIGGRPVLPPTTRAGVPRAVDPEAYDAYLKGLAAGGRGTYDGFRNAVAYFEEAVARQPDFALAYAALAQHQQQFLFGGPLSPRETTPKTEAAARRAIQLDDTIAQAHRTLGQVLHYYYWQWEEGDKEFERARELGRSLHDQVPMVAAAASIRRGRVEQAIAEAEQALTLDPLSFGAYVNLAVAYRAAGQYDRAIAEIHRALEITPQRPRAHFQLGVTFLLMGRVNDAIGELETAVESAPGGNARFQAYLGYAYAATGRRVDARRMLTALELQGRQRYVSSFGIALIHDALGEKEAALVALERAYEDRAIEFAQMAQYPAFKTIASEPRFQAVMKLIGLPR